MSSSLLQQLRDEFPTLEIEFKDDSISVNMQGFWFSLTKKGSENKLKVDEDAKKHAKNFAIFKEVEASLIEKDPDFYRGAYLVVDDDKSRFVHFTEDSAFKGRNDPQSYVGKIGCGEFKEEILLLSDVEKPPDFDSFENRYERPRITLTLIKIQLTPCFLTGRSYTLLNLIVDII